MMDVLSEIFSGITEALFGDWYNRQSGLTKGLIQLLMIILVAGVVYVLYRLYPSILGIATNSR
ncbi:MAG: hypothetical protein WD740_04035 [Anaerolineales bacterium]